MKRPLQSTGEASFAKRIAGKVEALVVSPINRTTFTRMIATENKGVVTRIIGSMNTEEGIRKSAFLRASSNTKEIFAKIRESRKK